MALNISAQDYEYQRDLIMLLSSPLSAFIIISNLFIIVGIVFNRKLHNTTHYFFLSLLFADFFTGVALPFIPKMRFNKELYYFPCMAFFVSPNFFFLSFLTNLLMVHYEKYLCIIYPLHYRSIWLHRCVPFSLILVWTLPFAFSCLPMMGWNNWGDNGTCSYRHVFTKEYIYLETYGVVIPAILAISFITIKVLSVARRQLKDIKKLHRSVQRGAGADLEHQMDIRYAKCIAIVSLTFLICWVPYIAFLQVSVLAMEKYEISWWIILTVTTVGSGSAAVIPIILGLSHQQYTELWRNLFKKCCHSCCPCQKIPPSLHDMTSKEETLEDGLTAKK
ncbi:G- coupled bile acid receptor 1 [Pelobates cultripes]|uniref:G-protein coupled bile acid receptor 1 n=1 Tax=Pelobates cultripes TaxID=61616 RepID=A0AAD1WC56_PELCU|nr:G- coupled bile acid receptor 1 [Pelobates cultripes]